MSRSPPSPSVRLACWGLCWILQVTEAGVLASNSKPDSSTGLASLTFSLRGASLCTIGVTIESSWPNKSDPGSLLSLRKLHPRRLQEQCVRIQHLQVGILVRSLNETSLAILNSKMVLQNFLSEVPFEPNMYVSVLVPTKQIPSPSTFQDFLPPLLCPSI